MVQLALCTATDATPWREEDVTALQRQGLRVRDRMVGSSGEVEAIFFAAAPLEVARAVLWDHARFPEFMPHVQACRVVASGPDTADVEQQGGQGPFHFRLVSRRHRGPDRISWHRLSGDLRENAGEWRFERAPGGTVITYRCRLVPDVPAPQALVLYLQRQGLPAMVEAVRRRIEQQARAGVRR
ncbi:MAG: SRPBCC family protein [Candidatus Sericytochromatia bacterium]|nr:SRPBCC family protein [Candidatus Sericytochromatia bacterium]